MFFVFSPRPLTRLELDPTASWWPAESLPPCLMPSPPCVCWRTSTWVPASSHPLCALYWAGKSQAITGLRSHPTTSTWGSSASPWATWRVTSSQACCPRPRTGECWGHTAQPSFTLGMLRAWECLKMQTAAQTTSLGAQESPAFLDGMDCGSS